MSKVFGVEVTFGRSRQPKDYESVRAEVTLRAEVDDGEEFTTVLTDLLAQAAGTVYGAVGLTALAVKQVPVGETPPAQEGDPVVEATTEEPAKPKRKRRTKAQMAADKLAAEATGEGPAADEAFDPTADPVADAAPAAPTEITDKDLMDAASTLSRKENGVTKAKKIIQEFGVARLGEIVNQDTRREIVARFEAGE